MAHNAVLPAWVFNLHDARLGIPRLLAPGIHARVFAGQHAMVSVVKLEPHSVGTMHSHPEEQWGILVEGECTRLQGDDAIAMKAGDFWHTPGGVPHAIRTGAMGALVVDIFSPPRHDYTHSGEGFGQAQVSADRPDEVQG
jgi:quercetin dioxygenase-like cupin family protein